MLIIILLADRFKIVSEYVLLYNKTQVTGLAQLSKLMPWTRPSLAVYFDI